MSKPADTEPLYQTIRELVQQARQQVQRQVNSAMVHTYWQIGRLIIEHAQPMVNNSWSNWLAD